MASCFLMLSDEESSQKVNIDELYEKRKNKDVKQLSIFNKILNRIHKRIQLTGKQKLNEKFIWFQVPEFIFGEPIYDKGHCIAYLISKLEENGFYIRYLHPNTLFVNWEKWVPTYLRNEVKKKTGIVLDERGNVINKNNEEEEPQNNMKQEEQTKDGGGGSKSLFTPIKQYKPTGNLVYNKELFDKIEKKVSFV
jgi:hypothetical protein